MAKFFRSREDSLADDDVKTQLVTLGSQTAPGPLLVPGGATFLQAIHVAAASSNEAADQYAFLFRLEGPGLDRGVFTVAGPAGGSAVATGGRTLAPSQRIPINIAVKEGQEILVYAEALGDDMGTYHAGCTLEFGDSAGPEGEVKGEVTVEGDVTSANTLTRLTTQGSVTAPSRLTPPDATKLNKVVFSAASDCAADGEVVYLLRLGGDAIKGGEQTLIMGAESWVDVASGGDGDGGQVGPIVRDNLDLEITPNETLDISVEMCGTDVGSTTAVVTAMFE